MLALFLLFLLLHLFGLAHGRHRLMESMTPRESFVKQSRADSQIEHEVLFAVKQLNLDVLESTLLERSTPGNPLYQQWLSFSEVGRIIQNDVGAGFLLGWLERSDVKVVWSSRRKEYFKAVATVERWEELMETEFFSWREESPDTDNKGPYIRAERYSLPEELLGHVEAVFNVVDAPPVIPRKFHQDRKNGDAVTTLKPNLRRVEDALEKSRRKMKERGSKDASQNVVTIDFLNEFYGIFTNMGNPSLSQSVFETGSNYFSQSDLNTFQNTYTTGPSQPAADVGGHETNTCSSGNIGQNCGEGNLDIQYIMGISQYTTSIWWYVDGSSTNPFLQWITNVANDPAPPAVNSISYAANEQSLPASTLNSFNTEAMKLGAMGVTITASSGDNGVSGTQCGCNSNSGSSASSWTGAGSWSGAGYFPSFPATSPYVTAIGATMGSDGFPPNVGGEEIACQSNLGGVITSGGGFSTYFPTPSWQAAFVSNYFSSLSHQPSSGYNRNGRGVPDLSLLGVWYQVIVNGGPTSVFGTSCSSPVAAGMISLINAARLLNGLSSVGFVNPTLYSNWGRFTDITSGFNNCCSNNYGDQCCNAGFSASNGWDPVTGLGSIQYGNLLSMLTDSGSAVPTMAPTMTPTVSMVPTMMPTMAPTMMPTMTPTMMPTMTPTTTMPTMAPTTMMPTMAPTVMPTMTPTTMMPTMAPTMMPTMAPTMMPTVSMIPTMMPTMVPTMMPTMAPTAMPTMAPTTMMPTMAPTTMMPTMAPTMMPTMVPTMMPTMAPTMMPTMAPSLFPTFAPTNFPTLFPTLDPTSAPTTAPTDMPTMTPSKSPIRVSVNDTLA